MAITISGSGITSANIADGTITTDDINSSDVNTLKSGRKNLIINGGMDVWQRGTSFTSSGYTADRWKWAGGTGAVTQQAFTAGDEIADSPYYLRWAVTGNSQNVELQNNIEDVRTAAGKSCKLSFWAKSSTGTETLGWEVYQNFGSGGSALTSAGGGTYTPTTSWAKYTFDVTMGSMSGKTIGTGSYIWVRVAQMATTNTPTIEFAGVQLEEGSVATDFEHRSFGEELALCLRYYEDGKTTVHGNNASWNASGDVVFKVRKRSNPSVTYTDNMVNANTGNVRDISVYGCDIQNQGDGSGELYGSYSWSADAEL